MDKGTKKIEFEAICENMSFDGKGCVHYKNHVGFIPSLLEGEKARIVMTYYTSNQFTGYVKELLSSSKDRVKPRCPVYDKCGGCSLLHMSYEAQLEFKKERVKQTLKTIGGFKDIKVNNTLGMDNPYFYRNKIQMPLRLDKKRNIVSGFYQERTHNIIPINKCYIENEDADRILETIKKLMKSFKIQPYDEDKRTGVIRHILIRSSLHFDEIMVVLVTNCDSFPSRNNFVKELVKQEKKVVTVVQNINLRDTNVILGQKERILYGKGYIKDSICDVVFNISAMSFYQVNPIQTELLYNKAIENRVFKTPVGYDFLKRLQDTLKENPSMTETIADIPVYGVYSLRESANPTVEKIKTSTKKAKEKPKQGFFSKKTLIIINLGLAVLVILMFFISTTSSNPTVLNYEKALQNRYSEWEKELTEREQIIREKEKELLLNE